MYFQLYKLLAKYPSVGRVSAMILRCNVQSHKQQTCLLARLMEFRACLNGFQNEHVHLTTSVEVAGSSTLLHIKKTYELEHRNGVIKTFFQHEIVTHYHSCHPRNSTCETMAIFFIRVGKCSNNGYKYLPPSIPPSLPP